MYYYEGKYNEAAEMYSKALELNDSDYIVWSNLASAYTYSDPPQPERSLEAVRRAKELAENQLEVNSRDPRLIMNLAGFYNELGDEERAKEMVNRVINMQPGDVDIQVNIGKMMEYFGDRESALEWIGRAIENGYPAEEINNDPDPEIAALREDPAFQEMVENL